MRDGIGCQLYLLLKEVFGLKLDEHVLQGSIIRGIDEMHDVSKDIKRSRVEDKLKHTTR
jgi:hypothetical protein